MTAHLPDLLVDATLAWLLLVGAAVAVAALPWSNDRVAANLAQWQLFGRTWAGLARAPATALPELDWDTRDASTVA